MPEAVNPIPDRRVYRSALREEKARLTRQRILEVARRSFVAHGYAATTVAQIAIEAGVALDTVYATVGPKPVLFRLLLETSLSGTDEAVPAAQREYVQRIRGASTARGKLELYAEAVRVIGERLAPLHLVLRDAAALAPELARIHNEIAARRARNMRLLARDLAGTGELRPGLSVDEVADVVWTMNSPELYALLVGERRWSADRFQHWLVDTWCRLFLASPPDCRRS